MSRGAPAERPQDPPGELVRVEKLCKSYGGGKTKLDVLRGVDLVIGEGQTMAVLGASGAGKSTLLNMIGVLDRPTAGEVFYRSRPISQLGQAELAAFRNRKIGFVFQFHHLLPEFTALENVMLPALIGGEGRDEVRPRARALLEEVGLGDRLDHKPGELSGGEQQRTALVRALVQGPELVLADEPTGNLDTKTGEEVFELLLEFNRRGAASLVMVTHNEKLAARLDRRVRMVDGRIVEED
ncbi:MAG TPA: ABC transporter ATP-binding protein [Deltaproteobacteria bacterium]|nr:ABC transporter ATP-binding protein [Deltaproteobacteria bacterium]